MANSKEILSYIEKKKEYVNNDYKFYYIFEVLYLPKIEELYKKKLYNLERKLEEPMLLVTPFKMKNFLTKSYKNNCKNSHLEGKQILKENMISERIKKVTLLITGVKLIHCASLLSGFSKADIALVKNIHSDDETKENKSDDFLDAFEKLISDPEAIPSNSIILLNQDLHHMERVVKRKADTSFNINEKRRKLAAVLKGQKTITDFFKSTKQIKTDNKVKTTDEPYYKIEEIILNKRGSDCNIKILWIPKSNEELNPVSYISVFFYNEVLKYTQEDPIKPIDACKRIVDLLPNDLWYKIVSYIEKLEDIYKKEFGKKGEEEEESLNHVAT